MKLVLSKYLKGRIIKSLRELGYKQNSIDSIMTGRRMPKSQMLIELYQKYDIDPVVFLKMNIGWNESIAGRSIDITEEYGCFRSYGTELFKKRACQKGFKGRVMVERLLSKGKSPCKLFKKTLFSSKKI